MAYRVERVYNWVLNKGGWWAILGTIWFIFSLVVTLDFIRQMDATVTVNDRAAITEAGVVAVLVGNDIVVFFLTVQFIACHFFDLQVSATVRGSFVALESRDASREAVTRMSETTGSDGTTTTV